MARHFNELSEDDIREMARQAERENHRLDPTHRKPRGWHYRRAAISLGLIPLSEMTVEEIVWRFQEAINKSSG